jgi:DNA-binding transcriptional MerR regulator
MEAGMADAARLAIGDLARMTGTKVNTIRFYEEGGLLPPPQRTASGRRVYDGADVRRLAFIRQSRNLGFPLDTVRELLTLADDASQPCEAVDRIARTHLIEVDRKIADLTALRDELDRVIGSCSHGTVADCKIIDALALRPRG